jgi:hypothetical protein
MARELALGHQATTRDSAQTVQPKCTAKKIAVSTLINFVPRQSYGFSTTSPVSTCPLSTGTVLELRTRRKPPK